MRVQEAVASRIEIREYADQPVADEDIRSILEAGRLAPSGRNLEHWRFILVRDGESLDRLGSLSPTGGWVGDAAFAVVVCTDPTQSFNEIDAGRAVTHMQLVGWEFGIGSCLYTVHQPEVDEFLGVPDEFDVTAVIGFGYPVREVAGMKSRRDLDSLVFEDKFGNALKL